ncbi:hypothetical protein SAMN04487944_109162 [Gracilibacillus ureilyticus]|uniref:Uncharacterized protein n=2 Tax=Gracilibacillus ureilyticus TaxID=531814 RepID=A0A1H9RUW6_9BACI|nr:hypothetical protein SAMN04487944_109162 [Gracilibacillus ureilyticus]
MDTFQKNYWSMYLDFIRDFEGIIYRGYSLPYFCHLPSYILPNTAIMQALKKTEYSNNLTSHVGTQKEFQQVFNQFVQSHTIQRSQKPKGKVVIHLDKLLRFPAAMMNQLDQKRTILLSNGKLTGQQTTVSNRVKRARKHATAVPIANTITVNQTKVKNNHPVNYKMANKMVTLSLENYGRDIGKDISLVQKQAKKLLDKYRDHHLYSHNAFRKWLLNNIKVVMLQIDATQKFLKHIAVSCVVVSTTHSYVNRILAVVAASKGIPSICMQHGIIASELGYLPKIATVDAVYGKYERDWFLNNGAPKGSVEVIGHPRFDQISQKSKVNRTIFQRKLGLNPKRKTVMIAVRGREDVEQWRRLILTLSKKIPLNIVIKNYPSRSPHELTKVFPHVHSTQNYHLYDIFANVDAVISYPSTVGLEAMISNKPVFILDKNVNGNTAYYQKLDHLMKKNTKELANQVINYFTKPSAKKLGDAKRQAFLQQAYMTEKRSMDRLIVLINRLTK